MTKKQILSGLASATAFAAMTLPMAAGAQGDPFGISYGTYTGLTQTDIRITIANIIRTAMGLLGIIAVLIVLYGGFKWMTAAGNDEQVQDAKKILIAGVIGLIIIVTAYAVATFVISSLVSATVS
jgi:hypothetical protein